MTKIKNFYMKLSNSAKAAINTTWQSFFAMFSLSLLGWLRDVQVWAGSVDAQFPSVSPLGKAAAAAASSAFAGLVTYVYRAIKVKKSPDSGPQYK